MTTVFTTQTYGYDSLGNREQYPQTMSANRRFTLAEAIADAGYIHHLGHVDHTLVDSATSTPDKYHWAGFCDVDYTPAQLAAWPPGTLVATVRGDFSSLYDDGDEHWEDIDIVRVELDDGVWSHRATHP